MKRLLWLDLEMTGLNEYKHHIVEVAAIATDFDFHVEEEYQTAVFQPQEILDQMDTWCKKTHGLSGLLKAIPNGKPLPKVEEELSFFLDRHFKKKEKIVLAGNSIWNDRKFIDRYLPKISSRLHYRMVDVSSFKEIFRRKWKISYQKKNTHRALDDILESIEELKIYLKHVTPLNREKKRNDFKKK